MLLGGKPMQRCRSCIMPINYPRISFNSDGVCNFCRNHKKRNYEGSGKLKSRILSYRDKFGNSKYDCALGFSGGRDSSYLLYYLTKILNLKVIAFTIGNGNIPDETKQNIENITKLLNVDLVTRKHPYLNDCSMNHIKAWLHRPSAAMVGILCAGCRLGTARNIYKLLIEYQVPVYISGGTPFEGNQYKTDLLLFNPNSRTKISLILGYISNILKNKNWINNSYSVSIQAQEFFARYGRWYKKRLKKKGFIEIAPFYQYIKWEEKNIVDTIEDKLGWIKNGKTGSTWRGDCDIALLKLYLYKKMLGFNDKDDSLSDLVRDGQITREEALQRLYGEQYISKSIIKNIMKKNDISYAYFQEVIDGIN